MLASTSEVYGDPAVSVQSETYWGNVNPNGLRSCYDEGKRGAETLFCDYYRQYGVDTRIVRIFNTYGHGMSDEDGRVVSNFITQALRNEPITIYGDGSQTRSFMYVDDLVNAIVLAMRDGIPHAPINVGNPRETSVQELAETVLRLTESSSSVLYCSLPQDDPKRRKPNISRAMKLLDGWQPRVCLEEGLRKTIEFYKGNVKTLCV